MADLKELHYVPYDDTNFGPYKAREIRMYNEVRGVAVKGKNIAILVYQVMGSCRFAWAISDITAHKHSEPVAVETFESFRPDLNKKLLWLYTERAPCRKGPGMRNCHQYLADYFAKNVSDPEHATPFGEKTPVYYSFPYPSGGAEEIDDICRYYVKLAIIKKSEVSDMKLFLRSTGKSDRQEITKKLVSFDRSTYDEADDSDYSDDSGDDSDDAMVL